MVDPAAALALMTFAPLAVLGIMLAVQGRMGLTRQDNTWYGSPFAWAGYYGGMLLVVAALALLAVGLALLIF